LLRNKLSDCPFVRSTKGGLKAGSLRQESLDASNIVIGLGCLKDRVGTSVRPKLIAHLNLRTLVLVDGRMS
jgi:hypothetical protein